MTLSIRLEKRIVTPRWMLIVTPILSVASALIAIAIVFWGYGINPLLAYGEVFTTAFGSFYGFSETIVKAIPLMLCGVGLAIAFKALIWNIGAEGQLLLGATLAAGVGLFVMPGAPSYILIPTMFIAGFIGGAAWALIPGVLKAKLRVNEIITTLMMNYVAAKFEEYLVYGPWRGKHVWKFPYTDFLPQSARLPHVPGTRTHYLTLIMAVFLAVAMYFLITRTTIGYEIRVVGGNPNAARYAGISYFKTVIAVMLISGGLAGLAGVGEVAGIHYRLSGFPDQISAGYGYTAIIIALLARLNPILVIPASIFIGGLLTGGDALQVAFGLPFGVKFLFDGVILLFMIGGDLLTRYRVVFK